MAQRKVLLIDAGHQAFDELDAADLTSGGAAPYTVGGTDVPVTDGGTGASTASDARTNLGLGTLATQSGTFSGTSSGTNTGDQTRASLGLATSDTPQFAGVEVGAASDTTLARASAGVLSVEGNALYAAGGTDVAVADGGTGASTAANARINLGIDGAVASAGLLPTGAIAQTFPRWAPAGNVGLLSTGRMSLVMIWLPSGITVTNITFMSGTTALSVGVNQWFALFNASTRAKLAVTVDGTSGAWAANSEKTLALSSPFVTTYTGYYYIGIMVKATTVPTLILATAHANLSAVSVPFTGGNSTSGLTDPASCPDPAGAIGGGVGFPYAYVS